MKNTPRLVLRAVVSLLLPCIVAVMAGAQPLTLKRAVELALGHSPAAIEANADAERTAAALREARNQYLPQLLIGSGLGDSWGYPLSLEGAAPSLINISAQSALINPALRDFVRAARIENHASEQAVKERRKQIIEDTVITYLELVKWEQQIGHLSEQQKDAARMEQVVGRRIQEGVDSPVVGKQAQLASARARLHLAQARGAMDVLEAHLSQVTGLQVDNIQVDADSVPPLPELPSSTETAATAADASPSVLFAQEHAVAQGYRARAEHRALWPSVDFATQYAVLAKFNNWVQFFPRAFERNNATVGVVIRFPFFNASQHAHAEAADAEALRARKQVEATRNQVSQESLRLRRSVEQLAAAREVSQLEYEISKSNVEAVEIRMNSGSASVHDAANARAELAEKYNTLEDTNFELSKARIGLLQATGELERWAEKTP
ncbi:MAG: TolC family protein [Acidobacteria bacterium]|nr:TolC family protein [Acidobacteriota bacterium]